METITIDELREIGRVKGILSLDKFESMTELIRVIQLADGHEPCFMIGEKCNDDFCMWIEECGLARTVSAA